MHDIQQIAIHEAGHVLGHILTRRPFAFVTIEPSELKIHTDGKSLGYLQPTMPYYHDKASYSRLTPPEFFQNFSEDVTILSAYVAQRIFSKDFDRTGSKTDFLALNNSGLINQPEPLRTAYKRFLIAYTFQLLSLNVHKQMLIEIADELLKKKTLNYDEVKKIVDQYVGTE
jgi:hypothetical protein